MLISVRSAAMPHRFFSARVPIPDPTTWKAKQQDGIENTIATSLDSATGLERAELLAAMEGRNIFDDAVRSCHLSLRLQ